MSMGSLNCLTPTTVHPNSQNGQTTPQTPQFEEAREAVKADGLPSLDAKEVTGTVVFCRVKSLYLRIHGRIFDIIQHPEAEQVNNEGRVLVRNGEVICVAGVDLISTTGVKTCDSSDLDHVAVDAGIDSEGGSVAPGLSSYGASLGLQHIAGEISTGDGKVDSKIAGQDIVRAVDGLQFRTRDALLAYRSGVTVGITPPSLGLATAFSTGARPKVQSGAVVKEETALHVIVTLNAPEESVSMQIRNLRKALVGAVNGGSGEGLGEAFKRVIEGKIPLVVTVESADVMATLISLKKEVEDLLVPKNEKLSGDRFHVEQRPGNMTPPV
ncbi:hypothetical protein E1B28_009374 [Marasmius oreades]|uniref:Uncharacterized protein n=1 Tax=Marasmius oreades TaxID=181124 RepID=A0A9P7S0C4_9AGAR|nr:uncharacterized protein E1B28_009374 [Marasmius oreades]KAG7093086.1 hypothetical protein E1B28_009374 [Marasmius oreades]